MKRPDLWDDETLDRVLQDAVSVSPSPEFRARVSARIAREPIPGRRLPWWSWSAAAAAVAAGVLWVAIAAPRERRDLARQDLEGWAFTAAELPGAVERREFSPAVTTPPARVVQALFDPRERAALDDLLTMTAGGWLPLSDSPAPGAVEGEIAVAPIEIADIDIPAVHIATDEDREGEPEP